VSLADAYSATGEAWRQGPERVYQRLADVLVAASPVSFDGRWVADVGAGTGVASRAIERAGGRAVALDFAAGMLTVDQPARPPAVVADLRRLPLASGVCAAVVAAFSFNHVPDPEVALTDAARVVEPGGAVLVSAYAVGDSHPVKDAVDRAATEAGWVPEAWISDLRSHAVPRLATVEGAAEVAAAAAVDADVERIDVPFPELDAHGLVAWRLGMAQMAPFVTGLAPSDRERLVHRALELLGPDPEPLVRRIIVLRARV
jgi:SAM-dependent methyltransferase